jgi:RHS repeat-associated protein
VPQRARDPRLRAARQGEHSLEGPRRAQRSEHAGRTHAAPPTGEHQDHADELETADTISASDGSAPVTQLFDAFGASTSDPSVTRVGFTGQDHDTDLGLIDMHGRVYDPLAGRFMSPDPVLQAPFWSQGLNRYSYVFNDPINGTDPSGYMSQETAAGLFGIAFIAGVVGVPALSTLNVTGLATAGASIAGTALNAGSAVATSVGSQAAMGQAGAFPQYPEGGAPAVQGGYEGTGGRVPYGPAVDPGQYVSAGGLSPEARRLLKPVFDRFGYNLARTRINFSEAVRRGETDRDLISISPRFWSQATDLERMQVLTHEITHSVQFDRLGSSLRWRLGVERVTHAFNPVDPRFTLESIASRMEDFAHTVPP